MRRKQATALSWMIPRTRGPIRRHARAALSCCLDRVIRKRPRTATRGPPRNRVAPLVQLCGTKDRESRLTPSPIPSASLGGQPMGAGTRSCAPLPGWDWVRGSGSRSSLWPGLALASYQERALHWSAYRDRSSYTAKRVVRDARRSASARGAATGPIPARAVRSPGLQPLAPAPLLGTAGRWR